MNEQDPDRGASFFAASTGADIPTHEQVAVLSYLGLPFDGTTSRADAAALISQAETDPSSRASLQAWHREKYRLYPDLFTPPQRSFHEARWWQARVADEPLYNRCFESPSLDQALALLESLDRQEPGWEREAKNRRETRFMNEMATLTPGLCKPDCAYPQELPAESYVPANSLPPPAVPPRAPSAPFVPGMAPAPFVPSTPLSKPAWTPDTPPLLSVPAPPSAPPPDFGRRAPVRRGGGGSKWPLWLLLLAGLYALGAGVYAWWHRTAPDGLTRTEVPPPAASTSTAETTPPAASPTVSVGPYAPLSAQESRRRALAKHLDLGRPGSLLNAKFIAAYRILESQRSPRLLQPDWPEQLADEFDRPSAPAISQAATPPPAPNIPPPATTPPIGAQRAAATSPATAPVAPAGPAAPVASAPISPPNAAAAPPAASAAGSPPAPNKPLFITLDAVNKSRVNNYTYSWSPYYYADYDISFRQTVGIETKVRNMTQHDAAVTLRWMFFGRRTRTNERYVFSAAQKRVELAAGQTVEEVLDSPMLQSRAAVSYSYGTHYYSGSKYEGWLVQVLTEDSDQVLKQVGSSGYIEDYGKQPNLTALLKQQLKQ